MDSLSLTQSGLIQVPILPALELTMKYKNIHQNIEHWTLNIDLFCLYT